MKKIILPVLASLAFATPAMAGEGRIEARGGAVWFCDGCGTEDVWGMAAGYDFDLGDKAFAGVEVAGDKIGISGTKVVFSMGGRVGVKAGEKGKLFVNGGWSTEPITGFTGDPYAGVGYEQGFGKNLYAKVEYRHTFVDAFDDQNALVAGLGIRF